MPMEYPRVQNKLGTPSLETMTKTALKIVSKNENGFFLMVRIMRKYVVKIAKPKPIVGE